MTFSYPFRFMRVRRSILTAFLGSLGSPPISSVFLGFFFSLNGLFLGRNIGVFVFFPSFTFFEGESWSGELDSSTNVDVGRFVSL